jgi:ATP-dependent RNA helicase DHX37/DHR1
MASRVGTELGPSGNEKVSYQIRFDGTVGPKTAIKFMTDGILLRELADDFLLRKYSTIIIDEAHERSINTDILIGVMSRVVRLRENLGKQDGETKVSPSRSLKKTSTDYLKAFETDHYVCNLESLRFYRESDVV